MIEKFKTDEKVINKKEDKKRFVHLLDSDNLEVKKLDEDDLEQVVKIMRRCAFDVTEADLRNVVKFGFSYGAYVDRILVGVGLAWPAPFDPEQNDLMGDKNNALYNEDPAVLLAYEGRGVRKILLKKREEEAIANGLQYSISYLYEDTPKGDVSQYVREAGSQLEKLYLSEEYKFCKTKKGILAVKKLF